MFRSDGEMMPDISWNTPYIHGSYEKAEDNCKASLSYKVFLKGEEKGLTARTFLQSCWTAAFDTACFVCDEAFDLTIELPVRLIGLGQQSVVPDPLTAELPPFSVENYHLKCLQAKRVDFVAVSHPWHGSVANAYAQQIANPEAVRQCYEIPLRTLLAAARRFGPQCLLWHDYVSIPQWRDEFRGTTILPQVFKIFGASLATILHAGGQLPVQVIQRPDLTTIIEHNMDLKKFFEAHVYTRLWPIVEVARAGGAFVMDSNYRIMESRLSSFVEAILVVVNQEISTTASLESKSLHWISDLPLFFRRQGWERCFGYVCDEIASLGCRSPRDKCIGAAELLGIFEYATELPNNAVYACLWLAEKQISKNDYSPLLLRPSLERSPFQGRSLKGHTRISYEMWNWGLQVHPASRTLRLQNDLVFSSVNLIGTITSEFLWDVTPGTSNTQVSSALTDLLKFVGQTTETSIGSTEAAVFTHLFERISQAPQSTPEISVSFYTIVTGILRVLLQREPVSVNPDDQQRLPSQYSGIISLLAFATSYPLPDIRHLKSLNFRELQRQVCDPLERTMLSVMCTNCSKTSAFRAEMWQKPTILARLYQIPDLTYQYTAKGGTGVIMDGKNVIGRARFCASACVCNPFIEVEMEWTRLR
jgi:hypothetical protein